MRYWPDQSVPRRTRRGPRGFTLFETSLAIIIIGTSIISMLELFAKMSDQNRAAAQMTTAMFLCDNVQEAMAGLPFNDPFQANTYFGPEPGETLATFNDVDDFDGQTLNPPIDSLRQKIPSLSQYTQVVAVMPVLNNQLSSNTNPAAPTLSKTTYTGAVRVQVRILYRQKPTSPAIEVYRTSWVRVDR